MAGLAEVWPPGPETPESMPPFLGSGTSDPVTGGGRAGAFRSPRPGPRLPSAPGLSRPASAPGSPPHEKYAGLGLSLAGLLVEHIVSHPWIVLRRQCQVHTASVRAHHTPVTLVPVMLQVSRWQGTGAWWKGLGSTLTVRGLTLAVEDCTSKFTPWPKAVDRRSSLRSLGQHLLLKGVALAVLTPFYSASLVESVQSEIASERPGVLDVFKEGLARLFNYAAPHSSRMLPVWILIPSTVVHGLCHYVLFMIGRGLTLAACQRHHKRVQMSKGAIAKEPAAPTVTTHYHEQVSVLLGHLAADVVLFPVETILHRLHLQGCRTIIDNLDSGREVIPILTRYEGFWDCWSVVLYEEGWSGLFKGFGALLLQYGIHFALLRIGATAIDEVLKLLNPDAASTGEIKDVLATPPPPPRSTVNVTPIRGSSTPSSSSVWASSSLPTNGDDISTGPREIPPVPPLDRHQFSSPHWVSQNKNE
ncbi:hypothetical protein TCAL_07204 [Tigriopus californicus]|uniref:Solute carrier family 25 member 46 n=1 Tax=Tigriopus californicus TaxID=6832 RepID=A0A553NVC2_TIGCA|nr:mitochondrial outer membrane protein SLC25A46-like [Tigriopus californicus]TRY69383.1 hypothetical protein TCAL_07204 [Tigriopus californicus]|eukprot:TCALIF_07204-PA protein Name:"Similar to SLC25A46 Solute carrier family 25 member 46 (Gallus gallus)" AED:0.07 eAED:0.07 QI:0/-1/0/1/-1/1/1/0/473